MTEPTPPISVSLGRPRLKPQAAPDDGACDAESRDITTRDDIEWFVTTFYRDGFSDPALGPIFTSEIGTKLERHIPTIIDFWCTQLLGVRTYEGRALDAHLRLHADYGLTGEMFDHWLALFESTIRSRFDGPTAESAIHRAKGIARAIRLKTVGDDGAAHTGLTPS